jgi:hypothetical protein
VFWESISGKLAERITAELVAPATVFWAAGLGAWILDDGWDDSGGRLVRWFSGLSGVEQILVAAGALGGLIVSAAVGEHLARSVLRVLEGYWPRGFGRLRARATAARARRIERAETRLSDLEAARRNNGLAPDEALEFARLDAKLRRVPAAPDLRMPTRLGDILRSGETWPRQKYGLDGVVCWPRLWLVLAEPARTDLAQARRELDHSVAIGMWGALVVVWAPLTWWALPTAAIVASAAYLRTIRAAEVFADLVEAAFDVYRDSLYSRVGVAFPAARADERRAGEALTAYLWRGDPPAEPPQHPHPSQEGDGREPAGT